MTVHLVGAGPGDPELLTVKALRLLQSAEVVVYDRLADRSIVALASPHAELIDVGKAPGHNTPQDMISALLIHLGRDGREVVRLKGGDPFVFGRGGEEALALAEAGVPFTVVPGISSSIAGPAAAGIPVTHRTVARTVTTVTGTCGNGADAPEWPALAPLVTAGGTLVVLMAWPTSIDMCTYYWLKACDQTCPSPSSSGLPAPISGSSAPRSTDCRMPMSRTRPRS